MAKRENVKQILKETIASIPNKNGVKEKGIIAGLKLAQQIIDENWDDLD